MDGKDRLSLFESFHLQDRPATPTRPSSSSRDGQPLKQINWDQVPQHGKGVCNGQAVANKIHPGAKPQEFIVIDDDSNMSENSSGRGTPAPPTTQPTPAASKPDGGHAKQSSQPSSEPPDESNSEQNPNRVSMSFSKLRKLTQGNLDCYFQKSPPPAGDEKSKDVKEKTPNELQNGSTNPEKTVSASEGTPHRPVGHHRDRPIGHSKKDSSHSHSHRRHSSEGQKSKERHPSKSQQQKDTSHASSKCSKDEKSPCKKIEGKDLRSFNMFEVTNMSLARKMKEQKNKESESPREKKSQSFDHSRKSSSGYDKNDSPREKSSKSMEKSNERKSESERRGHKTDSHHRTPSKHHSSSKDRHSSSGKKSERHSGSEKNLTPSDKYSKGQSSSPVVTNEMIHDEVFGSDTCSKTSKQKLASLNKLQDVDNKTPKKLDERTSRKSSSGEKHSHRSQNEKTPPKPDKILQKSSSHSKRDQERSQSSSQKHHSSSSSKTPDKSDHKTKSEHSSEKRSRRDSKGKKSEHSSEKLSRRDSKSEHSHRSDKPSKEHKPEQSSDKRSRIDSKDRHSDKSSRSHHKDKHEKRRKSESGKKEFKDLDANSNGSVSVSSNSTNSSRQTSPNKKTSSQGPNVFSLMADVLTVPSSENVEMPKVESSEVGQVNSGTALVEKLGSDPVAETVKKIPSSSGVFETVASDTSLVESVSVTKQNESADASFLNVEDSNQSSIVESVSFEASESDKKTCDPETETALEQSREISAKTSFTSAELSGNFAANDKNSESPVSCSVNEIGQPVTELSKVNVDKFDNYSANIARDLDTASALETSSLKPGENEMKDDAKADIIETVIASDEVDFLKPTEVASISVNVDPDTISLGGCSVDSDIKSVSETDSVMAKPPSISPLVSPSKASSRAHSCEPDTLSLGGSSIFEEAGIKTPASDVMEMEYETYLTMLSDPSEKDDKSSVSSMSIRTVNSLPYQEYLKDITGDADSEIVSVAPDEKESLIDISSRSETPQSVQEIELDESGSVQLSESPKTSQSSDAVGYSLGQVILVDDDTIPYGDDSPVGKKCELLGSLNDADDTQNDDETSLRLCLSSEESQDSIRSSESGQLQVSARIENVSFLCPGITENVALSLENLAGNEANEALLNLGETKTDDEEEPDDMNKSSDSIKGNIVTYLCEGNEIKACVDEVELLCVQDDKGTTIVIDEHENVESALPSLPEPEPVSVPDGADFGPQAQSESRPDSVVQSESLGEPGDLDVSDAESVTELLDQLDQVLEGETKPAEKIDLPADVISLDLESKTMQSSEVTLSPVETDLPPEPSEKSESLSSEAEVEAVKSVSPEPELEVESVKTGPEDFSEMQPGVDDESVKSVSVSEISESDQAEAKSTAHEKASAVPNDLDATSSVEQPFLSKDSAEKPVSPTLELVGEESKVEATSQPELPASELKSQLPASELKSQLPASELESQLPASELKSQPLPAEKCEKENDETESLPSSKSELGGGGDADQVLATTKKSREESEIVTTTAPQIESQKEVEPVTMTSVSESAAKDSKVTEVKQKVADVEGEPSAESSEVSSSEDEDFEPIRTRLRSRSSDTSDTKPAKTKPKVLILKKPEVHKPKDRIQLTVSVKEKVADAKVIVALPEVKVLKPEEKSAKPVSALVNASMSESTTEEYSSAYESSSGIRKSSRKRKVKSLGDDVIVFAEAGTMRNDFYTKMQAMKKSETSSPRSRSPSVTVETDQSAKVNKAKQVEIEKGKVVKKDTSVSQKETERKSDKLDKAEIEKVKKQKKSDASERESSDDVDRQLRSSAKMQSPVRTLRSGLVTSPVRANQERLKLIKFTRKEMPEKENLAGKKRGSLDSNLIKSSEDEASLLQKRARTMSSCDIGAKKTVHIVSTCGSKNETLGKKRYKSGEVVGKSDVDPSKRPRGRPRKDSLSPKSAKTSPEMSKKKSVSSAQVSEDDEDFSDDDYQSNFGKKRYKSAKDAKQPRGRPRKDTSPKVAKKSEVRKKPSISSESEEDFSDGEFIDDDMDDDYRSESEEGSESISSADSDSEPQRKKKRAGKHSYRFDDDYRPKVPGGSGRGRGRPRKRMFEPSDESGRDSSSDFEDSRVTRVNRSDKHVPSKVLRTSKKSDAMTAAQVAAAKHKAAKEQMKAKHRDLIKKAIHRQNSQKFKTLKKTSRHDRAILVGERKRLERRAKDRVMAYYSDGMEEVKSDGGESNTSSDPLEDIYRLFEVNAKLGAEGSEDADGNIIQNPLNIPYYPELREAALNGEQNNNCLLVFNDDTHWNDVAEEMPCRGSTICSKFTGVIVTSIQYQWRDDQCSGCDSDDVSEAEGKASKKKLRTKGQKKGPGTPDSKLKLKKKVEKDKGKSSIITSKLKGVEKISTPVKEASGEFSGVFDSFHVTPVKCDYAEKVSERMSESKSNDSESKNVTPAKSIVSISSSPESAGKSDSSGSNRNRNLKERKGVLGLYEEFMSMLNTEPKEQTISSEPVVIHDENSMTEKDETSKDKCEIEVVKMSGFSNQFSVLKKTQKPVKTLVEKAADCDKTNSNGNKTNPLTNLDDVGQDDDCVVIEQSETCDTIGADCEIVAESSVASGNVVYVLVDEDGEPVTVDESSAQVIGSLLQTGEAMTIVNPGPSTSSAEDKNHLCYAIRLDHCYARKRATQYWVREDDYKAGVFDAELNLDDIKPLLSFSDDVTNFVGNDTKNTLDVKQRINRKQVSILAGRCGFRVSTHSGTKLLKTKMSQPLTASDLDAVHNYYMPSSNP